MLLCSRSIWNRFAARFVNSPREVQAYILLNARTRDGIGGCIGCGTLPVLNLLEKKRRDACQIVLRQIDIAVVEGYADGVLGREARFCILSLRMRVRV